MTRTNRISVLLLAAVSMLYLGAIAGEITVPITDYSILDNGAGEIRIAAHIPIPDSVADSTLMIAELSFSIVPQMAEDSILRIDSHCITTPWESETATWESPWQTPGGDFKENQLAMFTSSSATDSIAFFDITDGTRAWLNEVRPNYGLLFLVPNNIESRFVPGQLINLPQGAFGTVRYQIR